MPTFYVEDYEAVSGKKLPKNAQQPDEVAATEIHAPDRVDPFDPADVITAKVITAPPRPSAENASDAELK